MWVVSLVEDMQKKEKKRLLQRFFRFLIWNVVIGWEARDDLISWNPFFKSSLIKLVEPWVNE